MLYPVTLASLGTPMRRRRYLILGLFLLTVAAVGLNLFIDPGRNPEYWRRIRERTELRSAGEPYEHITMEGIRRSNPPWDDPLYWPFILLAVSGLTCIVVDFAIAKKTKQPGSSGR